MELWVITTLELWREELGVNVRARLLRRPDRPGRDQFAHPSGLEDKVPVNSKGVQRTLMMSKFARTAAVVFGLTLFALGQAATTPPATTPDAPSATPAPSTAPTIKATGTKVGTINIEQAIFASNEGQRDFQALQTKLTPKLNELKSSADELDSLKKNASAQQDKLNDDAREKLVKQIETKTKSLERAQQDFNEDSQSQQGEIGNKILTKMAPIIVKYAADNGFGVILDTSQQWPRSPVLWNGPAVDITQAIVEAYNVQSGVAAPPPGAGATRPAAKPAGTGTKPATTPATKPAATTPPKQ